MRKRGNYGFTLVELLIVIAVIAILGAVAFVLLNPAERFKESRDNQRMQEARAIAEAIRLYKIDNEGDNLCENDGENGVVGIGGTIDTSLSSYFSTVPKDPKYDDDSTNYRYYVDNYACCLNPTTGARVNCDLGGVFVISFESEEYDTQYNNYNSFCPSGSIYGGEAGGGSYATFDYVIPFTPSCWDE